MKKNLIFGGRNLKDEHAQGQEGIWKTYHTNSPTDGIRYSYTTLKNELGPPFWKTISVGIKWK